MKPNLFNSVKMTRPKENTFDLSHDVKFSTRMGQLTPCLVQELVPGDKFNIGAEQLVRVMPLIAPIMHRMDVTTHYFFVPNRILWDGWEKFITMQNGVQERELPFISMANTFTADQKKFMDYMGVPPLGAGQTPIPVSALPFAAYQMIYNEYYRDQNLIAPVNITLVDGQQGSTVETNLTTMRLRAYQHDYFTASLPYAQKGPDVDVPLGDVQLKQAWFDSELDPPAYYETNGSLADAGGASFNTDGEIKVDSINNPLAFDPNGTLEVGATTINTLRRAFKLQEWLEKNMRGGTRYIENILSHFGVRSSDKRLQRPEYITGVKTPLVISEVLNTSGQVFPDGEDGAPLPQGNMAGHGVSVGSGRSGYYYAEEHGYIIAIMSIMPKPAYQQGLPRMYSKFSNYDYYWPSFAHIGEQEVKYKEIYIDAGVDRENTFGYVPRYAEYKYNPSRVAGDLRNSLDYWHLGRIFSSTPTLSQQFIEVNPDDNTRIFAVEDGTDEFICHIYHKIKAKRPMPVYGTPML